jgi:hypothetical protein
MAPVRVSLSADTKDALARDLPAAEHCRAALRAGLALYGASAVSGTVVFRTSRPAVARLFRSLLDDRTAHPIRKTIAPRLYRTAVYEIDVPASILVAEWKPAAKCDRRMEIRAAFLACGSVAAPAHGYHLEFVPPNEALLERLERVLRTTVAAPKRVARKGRTILYYKELDTITAALTSMGAFGAVLHLEDVRAMKETKNRIHRLVNSEAANVERAAGAAALQRDAIVFLVDAYGLRNLSAALREAATLRLAHPEETLAELGRRANPPISKSTMNGRIMHLMRLARRMRSSVR